MTDTGAGTPLTAEEERDLRAWTGHGEPPVMARVWATLDAARSRPDPAGLTAQLRETGLAYHTFSGRCTTDWPSCEDAICVATLARLAIADGPGPEERLRDAALDIASRMEGRITHAAWPDYTHGVMESWIGTLRSAAALPVHREETGR